MIPKTLYFLWFGGGVPVYADYAVDAFRTVNPGFKIKFIREPDPRKSKDGDIQECLALSRDKDSKYYKIFHRGHFGNLQSRSQVIFNTAFSDTFRCFLLDRYGGIYLDVDMWPVRPFDDWLLGLGYFHV